MKSITFILPKTAPRPVGGIKVVFEYANMLKKDGYDAHIMMPWFYIHPEWVYSGY